MPLVAHCELPSFARLRAEGADILSAAAASHLAVRELHIGLLNMMPDAALQATERQFLRLVSACSRIALVHVHPFTVRGLQRAGAAKTHVDAFYEDFDVLRRDGLDAILVTGANPADPDITREDFWRGMVEVMDWAKDSVCSILCSCLATHGALKVYHGIDRIKLAQKRWGVYSHRLVDHRHPMLAGVNTRFDAPHSHVYEVTRAQIESAGGRVLVESDEAGVHLAVSEDGLRFVYFQGHPEYDFNSLLKEFKREVTRFHRGERDDYPPYPEHYFRNVPPRILETLRQRATGARDDGTCGLDFPEEALAALVDNTWSDTGRALFNNWLGLIYELTHVDRRIPFIEGVDPGDPLGWRARTHAAKAG